MTSLTRWDPLQDFASIRSTMDRLFDEAFGRMPAPGTAFRSSDELRPASLPIDVAETPTDLLVRAEVPGVDPKNIDISVEDDVLIIKGEHREELEEGGTSYLRRELHHGSFQRMLRLPPTVDTEKASARFEHGLLTLTLPKRPEARSRSIKITPAGVIEGSTGTS